MRYVATTFRHSQDATGKILLLQGSTIVEIFMHLAYSMDRQLSSTWSWSGLAITYVCHDWEKTLSSPLLWSWLPTTHSQSLIVAYITRSQPLTLPIDWNICLYQNCLQCISLGYLSRICGFMLKAHLPSEQW